MCIICKKKYKMKKSMCKKCEDYLEREILKAASNRKQEYIDEQIENAVYEIINAKLNNKNTEAKFSLLSQTETILDEIIDLSFAYKLNDDFVFSKVIVHSKHFKYIVKFLKPHDFADGLYKVNTRDGDILIQFFDGEYDNKLFDDYIFIFK